MDAGASTTLDAMPSAGGGPVASSLARRALAMGTLVGRYQVRRALAQGGMGRVYLARDTVLGRSVALKLVRPEADDGGESERFVEEARITARLNHPHIVQIHDVGRFDGFAYLALEYLEGESLTDRLRRGALSCDEALRVLRAIADALGYAHGERVFHCDLKPANVMLATDGRVRVVDFGLATVRTAAVAAAGVGGTPEWMAPEQWRGQPVSDRTDVWAFAVMAHQLLAGEHPLGAVHTVEERRELVLDPAAQPRPLVAAGVTDALEALALRSLSRDPLARPVARDWYLALDAALSPAAAAASLDGPFRGLAAFDERHAALFFGREADVDAVIERLRERPTVPIVGPSGVGKSSFLLAGLIPRLRARGGWTIMVVRPGAAPFAAVAHHLLAAIDERPAAAAVADLARDLRAAPALLAVRLETIAAAHGGQVLLAVDQLEEVFTQGGAPAEVERFCEMLAAVDDVTEPCRLAYTVRDDFLGKVPGVRDPFVVRRLGPVDLRRTITAPVERLGYRFDNPAIVDDMLAETGGALIDLPLVQFACRALWDARDAGQRTLLGSAYHAMGGVTGALARHADAVVDAMTADEQRISRVLLGRLVVGSHARRIVDLDALVAELPGAGAVIERLVSARLLVQHRPDGADSYSVELAHESLLVNWGRLRAWLDESSEERRLLDELDDAATRWDRRGARPEETWPEAELAGARLRARKLQLRLPPRLERFLATGEARHRARRRRARWRRAAVVIAALLIAAAALVLASRFRDQKLAAEAQARALKLAADDLGRTELVLQPFDWRDGQPAPVDPATLPSLTVSVYRPAPRDLDLPGEPVAPDLVHITPRAPGTLLLEVPGGTAYLRIDGRGRAGEACAASWIRIMALPGYADRDTTQRLELPVPTCAASADDMITIPAGDFIYGGPGDPPTRFPEYVEAERTVFVPSFAIDRTEVSNAQFAPFARSSKVTGYANPTYPDNPLQQQSNEPQMPVAGLNAFQAEAFCRYMGKRLPSDYEWTKAARGGAVIDGTPNPRPRRLYPWGGELDQRCVNAVGDADGAPWIAPVRSFECGASPYGVLHIVGNVAEWVAREGQVDPTNPLRIVRGGALDSPWELEQVTTVFRNEREGRQFDFALGVRCADGPAISN
jgi:formylglycine-generating enzyme required for sulfatase activity